MIDGVSFWLFHKQDKTPGSIASRIAFCFQRWEDQSNPIFFFPNFNKTTFDFLIGKPPGDGLYTPSVRLPGQMRSRLSRIEWPYYSECTDYSFVTVLP